MHTKHNSSKHCSYLPLRFTLFVLRIFAFHGICIGCACFEFLLSLFCSLLSYKHKHTHTHAHPHYICSCSHALSACHLVRSVAGPGTRPCPSHTHSLTHKHTHTQARLRVNKRLSVSLRFEKSNSDLFCQAHSSPYPPPTPYRTQLTAYSTMENNKKKGKIIKKCSAAASNCNWSLIFDTLVYSKWNCCLLSIVELSQ